MFNVKDFGAKGDGISLNTDAIQSAIDACHKEGGGTVVIENGTYKTGKIFMRSNVNLHIDINAVLLGSENTDDFPESSDEEASHITTDNLPRWRNSCLIFANECENISITGMGKIDCNGENFIYLKENCTSGWKYARKNLPTPPRVVFFTGCNNVLIQDVTMVNQPAGWSYWIHDCDYVKIDGLKIFADVNYPNNDGIHINCSRNVTISNCDITCGDDAIIVRANSKSLKENKVCEKVTVTNCNLTSYSGGIRLGWYNDGVIRNCVFSNIVMTDTTNGINIVLPFLNQDKPKTFENSGMADIGREATLIENISFNNIIMHKIRQRPLRIMVSKNEQVRLEGIRNIHFTNLHATALAYPEIVGRDDMKIKNISFSDCTFERISPDVFENAMFHGANSHLENDTNTASYMHMENAANVTVNNTRFDTLI